MEFSKFYEKLNSRVVSEKEFKRLDKNLKQHYDIIDEISYYNPNLNMFSNYFIDDIAFNNDNKIYSLIKKRSRISTIGYYYTAAIKNKNNNIFYKKIFMKEIPMFSVENIDLYNAEFNYKINQSWK